MIAIAHEDALVFLEFQDNENFEKDLAQIKDFFKTEEIVEGENLPIKQIRVELEDYFKHPLQVFEHQSNSWGLISKNKFGKNFEIFPQVQLQLILKLPKKSRTLMQYAPLEMR